jgi:hypothetical protein
MRLIRPNGCRPAAAILLSALAIGGCSADTSAPLDTFPRVAVSGTITLSGTPLPQGRIQFDPAQGTTGPTAAAEISEGKFSIEKSQGPVPGKYKIMISSRPPVKIKEGEAPQGTPKLKPETIPARYNTKSTLETEVPPGGSNSLEFALKKS